MDEDAKVSMSSELRDRDSRLLNIVINGLNEPPDSGTDNHARVSQDREKLVELGNVIGSGTELEGIRFAKRLGEKRNNADPRPLLAR